MEKQDAINKQLGELLVKNESLPVGVRLPPEKFILDEAVFEENLRRAQDEAEAERAALQQEAAEHQRAGQAVLRAFWLDMDQPGRSVSGLLDKSLLVKNFPVAKESMEQTEEFEMELQRNETYLSVTRFIAFRPWEVMTDSELAEKQHKSPLDLRSFKSIAEGFHRMLSEAARRPSGADPASAAPGGSVSRRLLGGDESAALALLETCDQVELNLSAYEATKHALLLARLVTDLRVHFNGRFEALRAERTQHLERCDALGLAHTLHLQPDPDLDHVVHPEKFVEVAGPSAEDTSTREVSSKETKRVKETLKSFDERLLELQKLRHRVSTAVTQEELKMARIKLWILTQSVLFATETNTREELRACSEAVEALSKRRQTLQARCERRRRRHERLVAQDKRQDRHFQQHFTLNSPPAVVQQLSKLYRRRPAIQLSATQLRMMDKNYLRTAAGVAQQQQQPEEPSTVSEEDSEAEEVPLREPCRLYMAALKIMDVAGRKASVDATAWTALCKLRRAKVEAEIRVKATALEVSEAEQSIAQVDVNLTVERNKEHRLKDKLNSILDKKRKVLLDIELQILLPLGQIEVKNLHDPKEIEEAVLVPRKTIRQLNNKIKSAGAAKMVALERSVRFREGQLEVAKWHLEKVTLQQQILKDELKHVEKLPITSEVKKFLKGQHLGQHKVRSCQTYERELASRRRAALEAQLAELRTQHRRLRTENADMEKEAEQLRDQLSQTPQVELKCPDDTTKLASEKSRLERKYKSQEAVLLELREQLEKMRLRTFPTLFDVTC